jgi:glycosyltransferase involved in cell wall biosynthesis
MQKNIAILIPTINAGGAEKQAVLLAAQLAKKYNVHVIVFACEKESFAKNVEILEQANVNIHKLIGGSLGKISQLKKLFKKCKIEILFNYLTFPNVVGSLIGKNAGIKKCYGGIRSSRLPWWKIVMERFIHNHTATATIYNCYSGAEYFENRGFNRDKNIVIPNCFMNISEPIIRQERKVKHIVTVGRFVPDKDYKTIIRTLAELKELRQDFVMDIIGYGVEEQNIRAWIKEYGVEEYIKINIRPDNVQEIVRDADIYLSTSLFEGTSNSIMEALNWSLPVVATNVGDNNHLVIDGVNGTLHLIGDAKGMAESIAKLLGSHDLRNKMGLAGNKNLRENYSMEIFEKRYLNLIEQ